MKHSMNLHKRAEMVRAMELIARTINNEDIFEGWLINGVADGDIDGTETDQDLEYYCGDVRFADLMDTFLWVMSRAAKNGGLYADYVTSLPEKAIN